MAIIYCGNCEWRLVEIDKRGGAKDLPTHIQRWEGRGDKFENFRTSHAVGTAFANGWIIDFIGSHQEPKSRADLVIAYDPDFNAVQVRPGMSIKTASVTASVDMDLVPRPVTNPPTPIEDVGAERSLTYYSRETRYHYFASSIPSAPRFGSTAAGAPLRIIRSEIIARQYGQVRVYTGVFAPAQLVVALTIGETDNVTGHDAEPITGTPWYRCTDVVSREFGGA